MIDQTGYINNSCQCVIVTVKTVHMMPYVFSQQQSQQAAPRPWAPLIQLQRRVGPLAQGPAPVFNQLPVTHEDEPPPRKKAKISGEECQALLPTPHSSEEPANRINKLYIRSGFSQQDKACAECCVHPTLAPLGYLPLCPERVSEIRNGAKFALTIPNVGPNVGDEKPDHLQGKLQIYIGDTPLKDFRVRCMAYIHGGSADPNAVRWNPVVTTKTGYQGQYNGRAGNPLKNTDFEEEYELFPKNLPHAKTVSGEPNRVDRLYHGPDGQLSTVDCFMLRFFLLVDLKSTGSDPVFTFTLTLRNGEDHYGDFEFRVKVTNDTYAQQTSRKKRKAEEDAAEDTPEDAAAAAAAAAARRLIYFARIADPTLDAQGPACFRQGLL